MRGPSEARAADERWAPCGWGARWARRVARARCGGWGALAVLGVGCSLAPAPQPFAIALRVVSDPGEGLAGAVVALGDAAPQLTDASGVLWARVHGREGDTVPVVVRCPAGYRSPDEAVPLVLRRFVDPGAVPQHEVACAPLTRTLVVAVRAPGGRDLPVLVDGQELARTDASGVATLRWDLPLDESVTVMLDTSAQPDLIPESPRRSFGKLRADEVVLFEEPFERRRPRKRAPSRPLPWVWRGNGGGRR